MRHHDLRDVQRELMRHGLSSLGRLESRVLVTLDTVEAVLAALQCGDLPPPTWPAPAEAFFHGEALLQANAHALLGGQAESNVGRIMVTLPREAALEPAFMLGAGPARRRSGADQLRA